MPQCLDTLSLPICACDTYFYFQTHDTILYLFVYKLFVLQWEVLENRDRIIIISVSLETDIVKFFAIELINICLWSALLSPDAPYHLLLEL